MTISKTIWLVVMSLGFYICGALCVFRTSMLVGWARRSYAKSSFVRANPFSHMVMEPWYPIYIRGAGIFIWLWAVAIDYLVLFRGFR
jgi:hypothetical protein